MTSEEFDKMTDEEKRIKVAELCGFEGIKIADSGTRPTRWTIYKGVFNGDNTLRNVPDYLNDLNACHEFTATLNDCDYVTYLFRMCDVTGVNCTNHRKVHEATAEQRCKAFVLTMSE